MSTRASRHPLVGIGKKSVPACTEIGEATGMIERKQTANGEPGKKEKTQNDCAKKGGTSI